MASTRKTDFRYNVLGTLVVVVDRPMETENSYYVVTPDAKQTLPLAQEFTEWLLGQVSTIA